MSKPDHIKIIKPGILSTLQDAGRTGYRHIGIGPGGVMDPYAFYSVNRLLGNAKNCPVIEMHFPAPVIEFHAKGLACLAGGDFDARLNGNKIPGWTPFPIKEGDLLSFDRLNKGFRCYLGISGGFRGDEWLGSESTHLTLGMGGQNGRSLQKDDLIFIAGSSKEPEEPDMPTNQENERSEIYDFNEPVLCMKGPEYEELDAISKEKLTSFGFRISEKSNRMAYLTESPAPLTTEVKREMLSSAVLMGTVQLLPDGNPAILMADHQTTGGFPRILQVLESQWPKLAQHRPGAMISFKITDQKTAEDNYLSFIQKCRHGG